MTKKKVTAPLTYNPGKGRPKEHLAYLNYQEMQALKRLNGDNMERGPRGLPSFPPADAKGSSSKASSTGARGPTGPQGQARTSPAGGRPGAVSRPTTTVSRTTTGARGPTGPQGQARTSPAGVTRGSPVSQRTTITKQGSTVSQRTVGAAPRSISGIGSPVDRSVKQAVERQSTSAAIKTSALKQDAGRSAIGGISKDKSIGIADGSKIRGAIQQIKKQATQPRDLQGPIPASVSPEQYGWSGTGPSKLAAYQGAGVYATRVDEPITQAQADTLLSINTSYDPSLRSAVFSLSPEQRRAAAAAASAAKLQGLDVKTSLETLAAESGFGKMPSRAGSQYQGIMQIGTKEFEKYADPASKKLGRQDPFANAQAGTAYLKDISSRIKKTLGRTPTSGEIYSAYQQGVTGFNKLSSNPDKPAKDVVGLSKVRSNLRGEDKSLASTMTSREFLEYTSQFPSEKFKEHTSAGITPTSAPPERRATPGLIQYPRLDRPTPPTAAQEAARLRGLMESYQQPPGYGKEIVDRIAPEYRPYDIRIPPKDQRVITKPELSPRSAEEVSPLLKSFSERVPQEGTLEEGRLMGDLIAQDIFRKNNLAEIEAQSPSYGRLGAVDERMLYNPSEATTERMRQVFDRSRGMSYTPGLPAPMPSAPIPRPRPDVQGPPRPIRGMSFTGMPDQMFVGAEVPYRPYDITPQEPSYRPYDIRVTSPPAPIMDVSYDTGLKNKIQDRILPQSKYAGYGEFTVPAQERNLESQFVGAEVPYRPYDISLPETTRGVQESYRWMVNPTAYTNVDGINRLGITPEERMAMDALYEERIGEGLSESPQYSRVETEEAISPFGPRSYDSPYPTDENGEPIQNVSESDLAKIRTRRRGEEYIPTPEEKNAIRAGKIVTNVITGRIPGLNKIINTEEKMKDFYSRPSWEQEYIAQRASDWAAIRGERPVTKAEAEEIKERTGRDVPRKPGGISGLGGGRDQTYEKIVSEIPDSSAPETPSTPSAPSGRRPDIYYMWDLGVNIPSPGDPNYTQYQAYLAERLAAQQAMGYV